MSPTNQHPTFYRPDALPVAQPTLSITFRECELASPCSPWGLPSLSLPIKAPGYIGWGLQSLSSISDASITNGWFAVKAKCCYES